MAQNISEKFMQDFTPNVKCEYVDLLYISLIIAVVIALYYYCYYRFQYSNIPSYSLEHLMIYYLVTGLLGELPLPTALLVLLTTFCKSLEKEGICLIWCMRPNLFIFHERYIKLLLNDEASIDKPVFYDIFSDMIGKSIVTLNGSKWKQTKKTLSPLFSSKKLKDTVTSLNETGEEIVKNITNEKDSLAIDVLPVLKMGILKAFCNTMLDVKLSDEENTELIQYIKTTSSVGRLTVDRCIKPWLWWKPSLLISAEGRKLLKLYKELQDFSKAMIRKMIPSSAILCTKMDNGAKEEKNLLYNILKEKLFKDPSFSMQDAEDAVNNLLFAGHDTTSYAILWCLFMLGLHQDIQEKAFKELDSVIGGGTGDISYDDLRNLKYLECIIKETLRLYPVVPLFARTTNQDLILGKYTVPKNTTVIVAPYLLHRNPDSYSDPEKFDPERFNGKSLKHPWAYIPFSEGMRNCLGKTFAMMEMKIILAHILKNFKVIALDKREDILLDVKIVLTPLSPIRFQFIDRKKMSPYLTN